MLSIEKCRELIDGDEEYTDKQIEEIRTTLYGLAELALDDYFDRLKELNKETQKIEEIAKPHILRCRPGDWEHARRVASWAQKLGITQGNLSLIIVSSYIHDIGWRDLVKDEKITLDQLLELEPQANTNSEPFAREVLEELEYSEEDIQTIFRLIRSADTREANRSDEEIIIDSDALSKLDINHLREKFEKSEWMRLWKVWEKRLSKNMRTEKAKKEYPKLLKQLKKDIEKEM